MNILGIVIVLLILWLIISVVGVVIEGLFWLAAVGIILFLATLAWGWIKRKGTRV
ncbi:MAG: hypothetical protein JWP30_2025 [Homoserinimonas sp.]|jgi:hypothetical protein|nr:hypothetical protein [Homoserinimonas sp.]